MKSNSFISVDITEEEVRATVMAIDYWITTAHPLSRERRSMLFKLRNYLKSLLE